MYTRVPVAHSGEQIAAFSAALFATQQPAVYRRLPAAPVAETPALTIAELASSTAFMHDLLRRRFYAILWKAEIYSNFYDYFEFVAWVRVVVK